MEMFRTFRPSPRFVVNGDSPAFAEFRKLLTFAWRGLRRARRRPGTAPRPRARARRVPRPQRWTAANAENERPRRPLPEAGLSKSLPALKGYRGIAPPSGWGQVDDFAHNPDKVRAVLAAAAGCAARVLAVYQPHGYAPTRFLKDDFIAAFTDALRPEDLLWMPEIYYAGGTAAKTISSADLTRPLAERGRRARFLADRAEIVAELVKEARPGDLILVMGARDPSLGAFARSILAALRSRRSPRESRLLRPYGHPRRRGFFWSEVRFRAVKNRLPELLKQGAAIVDVRREEPAAATARGASTSRFELAATPWAWIATSPSSCASGTRSPSPWHPEGQGYKRLNAGPWTNTVIGPDSHGLFT